VKQVRLLCDITLPFGVRKQMPWWDAPSVGTLQGGGEMADHQDTTARELRPKWRQKRNGGFLSTVQNVSGARVIVPREYEVDKGGAGAGDSEDGSTVVITVKADNDKSMWVACAMIANFAAHANGVQILPCTLYRTRMVDRLEDRSYYHMGGTREALEGSLFVTGNSNATAKARPGAVLFNADQTQEAAKNDFQYICLRSEIPKNKLTAEEVDMVIHERLRQLFNETNGQKVSFEAEAWRSHDALIIGGQRADAYLLQGVFKKWMEAFDAALRPCQRTPLLEVTPPLMSDPPSTAAPRSTVQVKGKQFLLRSALSFDPKIEQEAKVKEYKRRHAEFVAMRGHITTTMEVVRKEKYDAVLQVASGCVKKGDFALLTEHFETVGRHDQDMGAEPYSTALMKLAHDNLELSALWESLRFVAKLEVKDTTQGTIQQALKVIQYAREFPDSAIALEERERITVEGFIVAAQGCVELPKDHEDRETYVKKVERQCQGRHSEAVLLLTTNCPEYFNQTPVLQAEEGGALDEDAAEEESAGAEEQV